MSGAAVFAPCEGCGEIIEAEILETSSLLGIPLSDADLPDGVLFGAVVRDAKVLIPRGETVLQEDDRVVLFVPSDVVKEVEKLFAVRLEFF